MLANNLNVFESTYDSADKRDNPSCDLPTDMRVNKSASTVLQSVGSSNKLRYLGKNSQHQDDNNEDFERH